MLIKINISLNIKSLKEVIVFLQFCGLFFFFPSPGLKPLYVLFEVLICSHQNYHMIVGVYMLLRWARQSSGEHVNG